ncbi:phage tail tape measure protein [Aeromonas jandaei]|uniref:phage tail tape measure protein n=1 Tax=Aeromonas jandaei TaxID=650 RepID=UPI002AA0DB48|nr:phage tail tape measure protein [Aeromonas jandaei]
MADNSMRLNLIMGLVDKITGPVQQVTDTTTRMGESIKETEQKLSQLGAMSKDIEHFRELKRGAGQTETALQQAQDRVNALAKEMAGTAEPTRKMTREFEKATGEVRRLQAQQASEQAELEQLRGKLNAAGVSTKQLNEATKRIRDQTSQYNAQLAEQQKALDGVAERQKALAEITERNKEMRVSATVDAVGVGAAVFGIKQLVDVYGEVATAQGQIGSLGIEADGIAAITAKAKEFSNQWSGTTQADFIKASYDIKSGISSLSDAAVGEFTKIAALTATATKSSTAEMTSLFASGYGIYRKQFDQFAPKVIEGWATMSAAERDMKFGEYFSAGISASVKAFKTDGPNMAAAISSLGAAATSANVPFAEQLSILGQLQATMSGSEAATKYSAFLGAAAGAGKELKLSFLDAENQLLSLPEILEELRGKYGDTIDALEEQELKKAFGTDEAIDMIKLLYPEVDNLKQSISGMDKTLGGGMKTTEDMAKKMQGPAEGMNRLTQRIQNLTATVGKLFAPSMIFVADLIGGVAMTLDGFIERFPILSQVVAGTIVALIAFKAASIAGRFAFSYFSDALVVGRKVMDFFAASTVRNNIVMALARMRTIATAGAMLFMAGTQKALAASSAVMTGAQWALNTAMMANPIGLVIAGIIALIAVVALVIRYWDPLGAFFGRLWEGIKSAFASAWAFIKGLLAWTPLGLIITHWEPLKAFFGTLWEWVKVAGAATWDFIKGLLGFDPMIIIGPLWAPLSEFFGSLWEGIKQGVSSAMDTLTNSVLKPLMSIKETMGGWWDSMFGGGDKGVEVTQRVKQVSEQLPEQVKTPTVRGADAVMTATPAYPVVAAAGVPAAASVAAAPNIHNEHGDIIIHAAPGQSSEEIAKEVRRQMDARDRAAAQRSRGRLYD